MRSFTKAVFFALCAFVLSLACFSDSASRPVPSVPRPAPPAATLPPPPPRLPPPPAVTAGGIKVTSPYLARTRQFRGQLHAHTTNSDGVQSPAAVMRAYRDHGYDFAAITDHNHNTPDPGVGGILFVPGVENDHTCLHENRIGATTVAPGPRLPQEVIDQAVREGSFVQINHPDWPGSYPKNPCWSDDALLAVDRYDAIEAWNNSCDWTNADAEPRIDRLLSSGKRTNLTAVDDCHDVRAPYCMVASVNVFADELTLAAIIAGLRSGNYYSSTGARFSSIMVVGEAITARLTSPGDVEFIVDGGRVAKTVRATLSASYEITGSEKYVRLRVTGRPPARRAWSNPIYVSRP